MESLPHADEAQALAIHCQFGFKSNSSIADGQLNFIRYSAEFHFEAPRTAREDGCQLVCFPFFQSSDRIFYTRFCLSDSQDEGAAGSTAAAAKIARVPARSIDLHAGATGGGDYSGRDRGLQLLTAGSKSG